ncbi:MAG: Peptidase [Flaviaesturariibacter sp.]|nr:Peptidase [Flaviaesturariibacter sp.]
MNDKKLEERLQAYAGTFHPVVPFGKEDGLLLMDFTAANTELTPEILNDTERFSQYVRQKLQAAGATYGIGGYGEHRTIYSRSTVFDAKPTSSNPSEGGALPPHHGLLTYEHDINFDSSQSGPSERASPPLGEPKGAPRRLHLGIDIWGPAGVPIYAPLEGTVHSFAFNDAYGDYGATLILQHELEGVIFHTLYGHLSLHSIEDKREGQDIAKGDWIAAFGEPAENGYWPPHLHFQVIQDMRGMKGDFPGVCKFSEGESYLANGPDGDLILGMVKYAVAQ